MTARAYIGISGWRYARWRGDFYPTGLPQRRELEYAAERLDSVEINGSFYSLQRPSSYLTWASETPEDFVFAVKGGRYLTHMRRLRGVESALGNFFASGVLALGQRLGPVLWQLPERQEFDAALVDDFLSQLPASTTAAAAIGAHHDDKLKTEAYLTVTEDRPIRHALEARHESWASDECAALLERHGVALVVSDGAGEWPIIDRVTADFAYIRLHGDTELYVSGYSAEALADWASRIRALLDGSGADDGRPRDVYVYFDNDAKGFAPHDAVELRRLVQSE